MSTHLMEEILHPKAIAILGASSTNFGMGAFLASLIEHEFRGKIYPVNPKYSEILGIKSYANIRDIPEPFEFAIFAIPAREVLQSLEECSQKGVKTVHLFTARFSETGRPEATELEQTISKKAKELGIRLLGPNCMGIYCPREGISWELDFPKEPGSVGFTSQSGSLAVQIIRASAMRGIRFSKAISYGNAIDLNESDFLDYFSQDPDTKIIMMYIEGVQDGQRFLKSLRHAASVKPVIALKGGRGKAGSRATTSHTASLAGSLQLWKTAFKQTGVITVDSVDELIDTVTAFYFLPPIRSSRVGVIAGAGGASVLAADICEEAGLDAIPLPEEFRDELKEKGFPVWDWISNPVDFSISIGGPTEPRPDLLQMMAKNQNFDLIITSVGVPRQSPGNEQYSIDRYLKPYTSISSNLKPLLALVPDRSPGINSQDNERWNLTCEVARGLITANIPFYPNIERAARAAGKLIDHYRNR